MGACCVGSAQQVSTERVLVEAERRALEAEKKLFELQVKQAEVAGQGLPPVAPPQSSGGREEHLTLATIRAGMAVKVTSSVKHLELTCQQVGMPVGQRREALGKVGRVCAVDPSDSTANVEWADAKGWMPVASLVRASEAEVPSLDSSEADVGELQGALRMLAAVGELLDRATDAVQAPEDSLDAARGFHFHMGSDQPIQLDAAKKTATCMRKGRRSVVTAELVEHTASADFMVRFSGGPVVFGVAGKDISGFEDHLFGQADFDSSLGVVCRPDATGFVVRRNEPLGAAPSVGPGDIVGVTLRSGKLSFVKNGAAFYECGVGGPVRFGVSLVEEGQHCTIVTNSGTGGTRAITNGPSRVMDMRI